ncbi:alpha/beta fold hydrolase [Schaalia sp. 19OD2882]|uniref:alpha/beta hydrolase n=1 Tax=Schaalia sp. 19OD2882 TaxID=2794089 RepID=UPI001C1EF3E2|nr:alpha/beta hydrolase [Schaalia sp. 19OD2882]QWW19780.1 alpha/beta fold hydrolase [Schaalia sp. 19OD2882]
MHPKPSALPMVIAVIAVIVAVIEVSVIAFTGARALRDFAMPDDRDHRGDQAQSQSGAATSGVVKAEDLPDPGDTLEGYYGQKIQWGQCRLGDIMTDYDSAPKDPDKYQCGHLRVPLDWDNLAGEDITLAIAVHRNGKDGADALFYNLGGPGGDAVRSLVTRVTRSMGDSLVENFDIVAVDPRGVGKSTPVQCRNDKERDQANAGVDDQGKPFKMPESTDAIIKKATEEITEITDGCQKYTGDLFKHIDTVSAAKDFDMVRAVLGQDKMHYLGFSYGTFLGATYADLFPDKVGRFVLDGALDPSIDVNTVNELQYRGFEASVENWAKDCQTGPNCPFAGTPAEVKGQLKKFLDSLDASPLPTADPSRPLTRGLAMTVLIGTMYSVDSYGVLTQALTQAVREGDGSQMLLVADLLNERNEDGTYDSMGSDALIAVNMLDFPPSGTPAEWEKQAKALKKELPLFGEQAGWSSAGLDAWPTSHAPRRKITAPGTPPIVVVGTTHDPATPYVMAQALAEQLSQGVLVTWEGWDHCAYSKDGSACVARAVEGYLVDGKVPEDNLKCTD